MSTTDLHGKVALVTGAASGIGAACLRALADAGAAVVGADLDGAGMSRVADELKKDGIDAVAVQTDVADPAAAHEMVAAAERAHGRLDICVNNAGIGGDAATVGDFEVDNWRRVLSVNL